MADENIVNGKIVTFYSYKGGTGRTMALANVGWILASTGLKVLVIDWDLDSPGLHRYFHPFVDSKLVAATPGVIELINDYAWAATVHEDNRAVDWHRQYAKILPHAISLNWNGFPDQGTLDYVSAGRKNRDYTSSLTSIDWDNFYDRLGGGQFIDALREDMKAHYDYTLIDSRTGLSDIADICTVHLPDILVDCFTLNYQSIEGAADVAKRVDERYHYRNIRVLPVAMRVDEAEKDKADAGLELARTKFEPFPKAMGEYEKNDYWASVVIPYKPYYNFEETLAAFGDAPRSPLTLLGAYERLSAAITEGKVRALGEMSEETRLTYRASFIRPRQPPPGDIYLSYVPQDRMWADWIDALLSQRGIHVLRPPSPGVAGDAPLDAVRRAATMTGRTIAILSGAYLDSPDAADVGESIVAADPVGTSRRLISVQVADVHAGPPFDRLTVDMTRRDEGQAIDELLKALGYPPKPTVQQDGGSARQPRYPRNNPPIWQVPTRNAVFTGRVEVLEQLHDRLAGTSMAVVAPMALHGLGGVGKTQVALEYAHRYMADYDVIWWIPAEQDELINGALAPMAQSLGIRIRDSIPETAQAVREALRLGRPYDRWLLIFDNADNPNEVKEFFPGGSGHVIVTTRNPAWSVVAEPLEIDVFSREESVGLFRRRVVGLSAAEAMEVAEKLGDLPLAIEQASAWLAETGMSAAEYVERLDSELVAALELSRADDYPTTVAATFRLSFERLRVRSPGAARVLELCAYFSPDPISLSLLYSDQMLESLLPYDERLQERSVLAVLIRDLTRYSLIKIDRGTNTVEVHRLVQAVIRAQMRTEEEHEDAMHEVHRILVSARPRQGGTDNPENWPRYDLIWPHLSGSEAINCDYEDTRRLLIDRVRYLWKRGEYDEALETGWEIDRQWQRKIGADHRQSLSLHFQIANVLRSAGRPEQAYDLDKQILDKQQGGLGQSHPLTLQTAGSLAADLRALGRFYEALAMDEETYTQLRNAVGPDEPTTLSAANNLAVDLRLVGNFSRARVIDAETLADRQRVLGIDHPYSLHSAAMLGRDMRELGEYPDSIELLTSTHERYHAILGEDFVDTLRTAKSLAVSLRKMGKVNEAYELTRQTSERYATGYGADQPDALACQLNLACDQSALDDQAAAYETAHVVLQAYEESLGAEHPFTLAARNNISTYLRGTGSVRTALELADRTLAGLRAALGDDHQSTLTCAVNRANCLHDLGRLRDAETQLRETLDRFSKTLGPRHPDTLLCQANLAVLLHTSNKTEDAIRLQQMVMGEMREVLIEEHPSIVALREWRLQSRDLEVQPT
jgi:MinD-like ATPase involved in chromosome partitioning or flagellar assembly